MDAVKFIKETKRLCESYKLCNGCILKPEYCIYNINADNVCGMVNIVEQWVKEHPVKTNGMKFCEVYGFNFPVDYMLPSKAQEYRLWLMSEYKEE